MSKSAYTEHKNKVQPEVYPILPNLLNFSTHDKYKTIYEHTRVHTYIYDIVNIRTTYYMLINQRYRSVCVSKAANMLRNELLLLLGKVISVLITFSTSPPFLSLSYDEQVAYDKLVSSLIQVRRSAKTSEKDI